MRIFLGVFFATLTNFVLGILGFFVTTNYPILPLIPDQIIHEVSGADYLSSFMLKFFVILTLTWIMYRVMTMLDAPKKRVLFIFLLGSAFSIYYKQDIFWSEYSFYRSLLNIVGESLNWLITGYVLSKFVKPKHLGAF